MAMLNMPSRQSNIELLRIIAMMLVLLVHSNFLSLGYITTHDQVAGAPMQSFVRIEFESLALICVNLFVLISGYFGIRPKARSVGNLFFQFLFWRLAIACAFVPADGFRIGLAIKTMIPGTFDGDWFIPCYFMLMLVAPALNAYIDSCSRRTLGRFLVIFYSLQTLFGWITDYWPYGNGYSFVAFIGLYVLGRYVNLYLDRKITDKLTPARGILVYVLTASVAAAIYFGILFVSRDTKLDATAFAMFMRYNSPFNVIGAVALLIAFTHLRLSSTIINRLAKSAFVVYIIHLDPFVIDYYKAACIGIYDNVGTWLYPIAATVFAALVYIVCAACDTVRLYLWNRITMVRRFSLR